MIAILYPSSQCKVTRNNIVPTPFRGPTSQTRDIRSLSHDIKLVLNNLIFRFKNPLPFEIEARSIHTIPLLREHLDSYLSITSDTKYVATPVEKAIQIIFNPVTDINTGICYRTNTPQKKSLRLSIQYVSLNYIEKLLDHNENLVTLIYRLLYQKVLNKNLTNLKFKT